MNHEAATPESLRFSQNRHCSRRPSNSPEASRASQVPTDNNNSLSLIFESGGGMGHPWGAVLAPGVPEYPAKENPQRGPGGSRGSIKACSTRDKLQVTDTVPAWAYVF
jgi:hypothetical protein